MKITLFSTDKELCDAWGIDFAEDPDVTVLNADYRDLAAHDAIVSPANSFGIMNGGLDLAIRTELGVEVQDTTQWCIQENYCGCQPVGTTITVKILDPGRFRYLIHAPTMQFPQDIRNTLNPLHSFYAALAAAQEQQITTLACSGMGAGTGMVPPEEASRQMHLAFNLFTTARTDR
ncbi:MAG: macro domain-containing protein [Micrococcales bacterium]|nr:macro domain-containing protein [Micrococcales bacterium]